MFQATLAVLDQHAALYPQNTALLAARAQLAGYVADLDPTADKQQRAGAGSQPAAVKKQTRLALVELAAEVAAALSALADELKDTSPFTDADYTDTSLSRQTDNDLLRIAQQLRTQATTHLKDLEKQGITEEEINTFGQAIATFQQEQAVPRTTIAGTKATKATNAETAADVREAGSLLRKRVDKYMIRYRRPQLAFYTAYQSARLTINTAAHRSNNDPAPDTGAAGSS